MRYTQWRPVPFCLSPIVDQEGLASGAAPGFNIVWQNLRLMQRIARCNGKDVLPIDFHACNAYDNGQSAAMLLHCPALFVIDAITTDKQVVVLPDAGHNLTAEDPDSVRRALEQFARRVLGEPRRAAA